MPRSNKAKDSMLLVVSEHLFFVVVTRCSQWTPTPPGTHQLPRTTHRHNPVTMTAAFSGKHTTDVICKEAK